MANPYNCETCNWNPSDLGDDEHGLELFYHIKDGKAIPIKDGWISCGESSHKPNEELFKKMCVEVYPKRLNGAQEYDSWSGASGHSWKEIHKCPNCNQEFYFTNSTI
jgi:hypothetical protein